MFICDTHTHAHTKPHVITSHTLRLCKPLSSAARCACQPIHVPYSVRMSSCCHSNLSSMLGASAHRENTTPWLFVKSTTIPSEIPLLGRTHKKNQPMQTQKSKHINNTSMQMLCVSLNVLAPCFNPFAGFEYEWKCNPFFLTGTTLYNKLISYLQFIVPSVGPLCVWCGRVAEPFSPNKFIITDDRKGTRTAERFWIGSGIYLHTCVCMVVCNVGDTHFDYDIDDMDVAGLEYWTGYVILHIWSIRAGFWFFLVYVSVGHIPDGDDVFVSTTFLYCIYCTQRIELEVAEKKTIYIIDFVNMAKMLLWM